VKRGKWTNKSKGGGLTYCTPRKGEWVISEKVPRPQESRSERFVSKERELLGESFQLETSWGKRIDSGGKILKKLAIKKNIFSL